MKKTLTLIAGLFACSQVFAGVIYVNSSTTEAGDGSAKAPFNSLSAAIAAAAAEGDEIRLAQGVYLPEKLEAPRNSTFKIAEKSVTIIGGYNSDFSAVTGVSTLSADFDRNDVYDPVTGILTSGFEENATRVMTVTSTGSVVLKNLVLKGGYADLTDQKLDTGGGMYIGGPTVMENCTVTGNYCKNSAGGGGLCVKGNLTMNNCVLSGNYGSGDGGGMFIKGDINVVVTNCRFENNKSTSGAGMFFNNALSCYFAGCSFTGNVSETYGTFTIYNKSYSKVVTVVNSTFANNRVTGNVNGKQYLGGSAIYAYTAAAGQVNVVNCTAVGNSVHGVTADGSASPDLGGALYARQGKLLIANNIIAGNTSLSGYGDLYKISTGEVDSRQYNFYTSYDNVIITPERYDIVAGLDRNAAYAKLPQVLDCSVADGVVTANCKNNGGFSNTVKVLDGKMEFDGLSVASVPVSSLTEETLGVDLNNDKEVKGALAYDQRGAKRSQKGAAFMGAYEEDPDFTSAVSDVHNDFEAVVNGSVIKLASPAAYSVFTASGALVTSGYAESIIDLKEYGRGFYVVSLKGDNARTALKIAF